MRSPVENIKSSMKMKLQKDILLKMDQQAIPMKVVR